MTRLVLEVVGDGEDRGDGGDGGGRVRGGDGGEGMEGEGIKGR